MFKLLKQNKIFRVFLAYQFFSSIGSAMFSMFILLSVHLIYENPIYTGIAGFLMAAPVMFSVVVGPIVDRGDKVKIMRISTLLEFLVLALLAFTPLSEHLGVLFMFAVIFAYNIAFLFERPAGTTMLPQIVGENDILQANSVINIVSMLGGIGIGIVLFASVGGEIPFSFLYGVSAVFVALAFICSLFLKNTEAVKSEAGASASSYLRDLKQGAKFVKSNVLLFVMIAVVAMGFTGEMAYVSRPMFLEYHVGAQGYVLFVLMVLVGGVVASFFVSKLGNRFKLGKFVFVLFMLAAVMRVVFALVVPLHLVGALITVVIFSGLVNVVGMLLRSLNQKIPPKDMVGRVGTISTTFVAIFVALGALVGGFLGSVVSDAAHIFIYHGISLAVIGIYILLVPRMRKLPKMDEIERVETDDMQ
ncbi:MAG: MFS transporter [Defluviitaleaceae bacterium]|nr:MFS transporter [Defluviitaleaceae bacterium]